MTTSVPFGSPYSIYSFIHLDIGKGYWGSKSSQTYKKPMSLAQCFNWCKTIRKQKGKEYNGVWYRTGNKQCGCVKWDKGHTNDKRYVHYRWVDTSHLLNSLKGFKTRVTNSKYLHY